MLLADMIGSLLGNPVERPKYESLLADDRLAPRSKEKPSESVPQYITKTLKKEGGYQSNREDKGNWTGGKVNVGRNLGTNFGITPVSWAEFLIGDGGTIPAVCLLRAAGGGWRVARGRGCGQAHTLHLVRAWIHEGGCTAHGRWDARHHGWAAAAGGGPGGAPPAPCDERPCCVCGFTRARL